MVFTIKTDQRVTLVGKTGSGKTYAARFLLKDKTRLVVIDPKNELDRDEWNLVSYSQERARQLRNGRDIRIHVAPRDDNAQDFDWESYYRLVYEASSPKHPVTIYTDEVYGILPRGSAVNPGYWLTAVYTRGRSRHLSAWAATQRPRRIPLYMITEADWLAVYYLRAPIDRQYVAEILGDKRIEEEIPDEYGFWLQYARWRRPVYYRTIQGAPSNGNRSNIGQRATERV
jgi:hypothetical protein